MTNQSPNFMSAKVFGSAFYGVADDATATGLKLANISYASTTDRQDAEDHVGSIFAFALTNDVTEVTFDGVVATASSGIGFALSDVLALDNTTENTLNLEEDPLFTSVDANAGPVVTSLDVSRNNRGFETGNGTAFFAPLVATNSPSTVAS